jgi:anti-sigma regulatory factor (Ser/Thr protein kinase)
MATIQHHGLLYRSMPEFLDITTPFLRAGVAADEVVFAVVPEPRLSALRDTVGTAGAAIGFLDAADFYQHPVRTIRSYDQLLRQYSPQPLRVVAEPIWVDRDPAQTREWVRYESLVNAVFATAGAQVICAYDQTVVPAPVLADARRTHPRVIDGGAERPSRNYQDPETFGQDRAPYTPPPDNADSVTLRDIWELPGMRSFVNGRALEHGLEPAAIRALATAVTEVATNALRHGTAPVRVWIWRAGHEVICEVADQGSWRPGPLIGHIPPVSALHRGFGLWAVRLLVEWMRVYADLPGTHVRLAMHVSLK